MSVAVKVTCEVVSLDLSDRSPRLIAEVKVYGKLQILAFKLGNCVIDLLCNVSEIVFT